MWRIKNIAFIVWITIVFYKTYFTFSMYNGELIDDDLNWACQLRNLPLSISEIAVPDLLILVVFQPRYSLCLSVVPPIRAPPIPLPSTPTVRIYSRVNRPIRLRSLKTGMNGKNAVDPGEIPNGPPSMTVWRDSWNHYVHIIFPSHQHHLLQLYSYIVRDYHFSGQKLCPQFVLDYPLWGKIYDCCPRWS
jgi:hypothetical protein